MPHPMSPDTWHTLLVEHSRLVWGEERTQAIDSSLVKAGKNLSVLTGLALDAHRSVPFGCAELHVTTGEGSAS